MISIAISSSSNSLLASSSTSFASSHDALSNFSSKHLVEKRGQVLKNVNEVKDVLAAYSKTLEIFKTRVGEQNYFDISATAIEALKKNSSSSDLEKTFESKVLLTKCIFSNLFENILLMKGDSFLRKLFPNEEISSPLPVMNYSINPDVLKKMHEWIEDQNLIIMMRSIAGQNTEVSQALDQNLLADIDSASLEAVHARAKSFRSWINGNSNVLLNVVKLHLNNIGLTFLPSEIDKFINLKDLFLENNHLTQLPSSICNLINLKWLNLRNNMLTQLPGAFGSLQNLEAIDLAYNFITQLPSTFYNLRNLRTLCLADNRLTQLSDNIDSLRSLERLFLDGNCLKELPRNIGNLGRLCFLDLSENPLTQLPDTICNLGNLQELYFGDTHITKLPDNIDNLRNLRHIELSELLITQLPDMTNLSADVRKEILRHVSLKLRVCYCLSPCVLNKKKIIGVISFIALGYLTYTSYLSNKN
jgi:Leucine-rich repeat (LRR) protein